MRVLQYDTKKLIRGQLENLIKAIRPEDLDIHYNHKVRYADELIAFIRGRSHIFGGEAFHFRKKRWNTFVTPDAYIPKGATPEDGKSHWVAAQGERIDTSKFQHKDWSWLERAVRKMSDQIRFRIPDSPTTGYILSEQDKTWTGWSTSDCFFTAMLALMGLRFTGTGEAVETAEKTVEALLAGELGIPMKVVVDEVLIFIVESRLGWTKVNARKKSELAGSTTVGRDYLMSYCTDDVRDAWHVILATRTEGGFTVRDRQQIRKGNAGALPVNECEVVAWHADTTTSGFRDLTRSMGIDALRETHGEHLE
ncbi:MAG: hypothetical protein AAF666_03700 [Pseudomonadota bacterium]